MDVPVGRPAASPASGGGQVSRLRRLRLVAGLITSAFLVVVPLASQVLGPVPGSAPESSAGPASPASAGDGSRSAPAPIPAVGRSSPAQRRIDRLSERLRASGDDPTAYRDLGLALLQRVRETGDPSLYTRADEAFTRALALRPDDPEILVGIGVLQLARHEFAAALETGRAALRLAPLASARGVVVDALVELGRYDEAIDALQEMVDQRPDLTSLSRVSYLRELHGDLPGALAAMEEAQAASAGSPENVAYVSVLRGNLLGLLGRIGDAAAAYEQALEIQPDYPPALAGLGRLAVRAGDLAEAIRRFERAAAIVPLPEYVIALGEAHEAAGNSSQAREAYDLVRLEIRLLEASGVVADVELALFEADHGDPTVALRSAQAAYDARRTVRTADTLAWAAFRNGDVALALERSREAVRLGTRDPVLLFHAGTIRAAAGLRADAARDLSAALDLDAGFSATGARAARELLLSLN